MAWAGDETRRKLVSALALLDSYQEHIAATTAAEPGQPEAAGWRDDC